MTVKELQNQIAIKQEIIDGRGKHITKLIEERDEARTIVEEILSNDWENGDPSNQYWGDEPIDSEEFTRRRVEESRSNIKMTSFIAVMKELWE